MAEQSTWIDHFPGNFMWSNATLVTKGMAPYGAVALEEIDRVCQRLKAREGEPHAWWEEWCAMGTRLERKADEEHALGHALTAANYYLRAGMYYFTGERFIVPGEAEARGRPQGDRAPDQGHSGPLSQRRKSRSALRRQVAAGVLHASTGRLGTRADRRSVRRAGQLQGDERALRRARVRAPRHAYARDRRSGTGRIDAAARHQHALRLRGGRHGRIQLCRRASGGRSEARDGHGLQLRRLLRAAHLRVREALRRVRRVRRDALEHGRMGRYDPAGARAATRRKARNRTSRCRGCSARAISTTRWRWRSKFNLHDVAKQIECAFLVAHGENDRIVPLDSARKLFEAVGSKRKTFKIFKAEEGGAEHVQVDNRQVGVDYIADWIEDNVRG